MKRFITILLVIQLLMLSGCTLPFFGKTEEPSAIAEDQEMLKLQESEQTGNTGITPFSIAGNSTKGTTDGTTAAATEGATAGVTSETAGLTAIETEPLTSSALSGALTDSTASQGTTDQLSENGLQQVEPVSGITNESETGVLSLESSFNGNSFFSEPRRPVTVYYQDGEGCLVPMTRWIQPQQGIARASISLIADSAVAREEVAYYGVYPVLPENTELLGIDIRDGIATIDFSRQLLNYGNELSERNIVASLVYTLTEFETIDKVRILINGYSPGILKFGTDLSEVLGRENVMINADPSDLSAGVSKIDVFLLKQANIGFTYPVPVSVINMYAENQTPELLVKQLLYTEAEGSLVSEVPDGAFLIDSITTNGIITLNFNKDFVNYGGTTTEEGILKQLAYTLRQCEGIRKIKIVVEGREIELPEGTDISSGIAIPVTINDVMDR